MSAFPQFVDSTMLAKFKECPMAFHYSFIDHLAPLEPSVHLNFGAALAAGIAAAREAYYIRGLDEEQSIALGLEELLREWHPDVPHDGRGTAKSLSRCVAAYTAYFEHFPLPTDSIKPHKGMIEFSFAIPLSIRHPDTDEPIIYCGRFDMVGEDEGGNIWAVDEKTTSQMGQSWAKQWDLRGQFLGYNWALREHGYSPLGTIVRGICILKTDIRFSDDTHIMHPEFLIDRWLESTEYYLRRAVDAYRRGDFPRALDNACTAYGGCAYRDLCLSAEPGEWVDSLFTKRQWNPLKVNPELDL